MAIIGAGVSGIVTARVLRSMGIEVTVYEQQADLGGVWSESRAYAGIATQDDRRSYAFSDYAFPAWSSEYPTGAEVREYLEAYVLRHELTECIQLGTRVDIAEPTLEGWRLRIRSGSDLIDVEFDWLVAANGVFSTPHVPAWSGRAAFEAAGGQVVEPSNVGDGAMLANRRVVVVGWGKTACDIAAHTVGDARAIDVIARTLTWKYPKSIGLGSLTFRHIVLTRAGERLIGGKYRTPGGRVMLSRIPERFPRKLLGRVIGRAIDRRVGLRDLGLRPSLDLSASTGLVTDGFFESVRRGAIRVHREQTVVELAADGGRPTVVLQNGTRLECDVIVAATGYEQRLDFVSDRVLEAAPPGTLRLYRRVLAVDVPRMAVVGWAHSYRSPLTSELSAIWLGAFLSGRLDSPAPDLMRKLATPFPVLRDGGTQVSRVALPGVDLRDLDELLTDVGAPLTRSQKIAQRFGVLDPSVYAYVLPAVIGATTRLRDSIPV